MGVCCSFVKTPTLFEIKKLNFPVLFLGNSYPFSDLLFKSNTRFCRIDTPFHNFRPNWLKSIQYKPVTVFLVWKNHRDKIKVPDSVVKDLINKKL